MKMDSNGRPSRPQGMPAAVRMASGAVAGTIATVLMDATGTLFWERAMSSKTQKREREVEPRFPLTVLGERIAHQLPVQSAQNSGERISTAIHWGIGVGCGALHGLIEEFLPFERRAFALPIAAGMLSMDEFGFPAAGLCPWPPAFPWQTHARATIAHLVYGFATALFYEGMKAYFLSNGGTENAA